MLLKFISIITLQLVFHSIGSLTTNIPIIGGLWLWGVLAGIFTALIFRID